MQQLYELRDTKRDVRVALIARVKAPKLGDDTGVERPGGAQITVLATLAGAVLIILTLGDIFEVLFNPLGRGRVSRALVKLLWRMFRHLGKRRQWVLELAGPVALVGVIGT